MYSIGSIVDPVKYWLCGSYELLVSNEDIKTKEKQIINIFNFLVDFHWHPKFFFTIQWPKTARFKISEKPKPKLFC